MNKPNFRIEKFKRSPLNEGVYVYVFVNPSHLEAQTPGTLFLSVAGDPEDALKLAEREGLIPPCVQRVGMPVRLSPEATRRLDQRLIRHFQPPILFVSGA